MDCIIFTIKILFIGILRLKTYYSSVTLKRNRLMDILPRYVIWVFAGKMMITLIRSVEPLPIWRLRYLEKVSIAIKLISGLLEFSCTRCFLVTSHLKVLINLSQAWIWNMKSTLSAIRDLILRKWNLSQILPSANKLSRS